jgi:hypothetical protein
MNETAKKDVTKSPKMSDSPLEFGSSFIKKIKKPHPVAKIPTSARTSEKKVNILRGKRARFADSVNNMNDIEKNRMIEESL